MVRGLPLFRKYFAAYPGHYIIIGGTACDIIIDSAGFTPRATKDFDIILIVEALSSEFVAKFWDFVEAAGYQRTEKGEEKPIYYRFQKPTDERFPFQIELFARIPDLLTLTNGAHLTPIPADNDLSSLSAILMDDNYYHYTLANSTIENDIHLANSDALICLKSKAFLDLTIRERNGEKIDSKHIKKHKSDVFRLAALLPANRKFNLPEVLQRDLQAFSELVKDDLPDPAIFREMGIGNLDCRVMLQQLKQSFSLEI